MTVPAPEVLPPSQPPSPPPTDFKYAGWLNAVKGLTLTNVLVIALLIMVAMPTYVVYRALNDASLLDRMMSSYEERDSPIVGCRIRHSQARSGPSTWGVSTGFAYQGATRWIVSVVMEHEPSPDEIQTSCESLKLIADRLLSPSRASADNSPDDRDER